MFAHLFCVVIIANSALSRNVPNFSDLDEDDKLLFNAAYDTASNHKTSSYKSQSPAPSYSHETPSYSTLSYSAPSYSAPSYSVPSYSASSYNAPSYSASSYNAPSYSASSYSAPSYNHDDYQPNEIPIGKLDLLKDGMWALKAKMKELKAFNKALAANLLLTKLRVKELMEHMKPLKQHQHVEVDKKPIYNYQPPQPYEQPHAQYTAPASSPQYTAQHYGAGGGAPQPEYDPYYGH